MQVKGDFFLDDKMYKVLRVDRTNDEVLAWDFENRTRVVLSYSYIRRNGELTYRIQDVAKFLNRSKLVIWNMWYNGEIPDAVVYRSIKNDRPYGLRFSPRVIMELRENFAQRGRGRPRKDGKIIPWRLPSKNELRAILNQEPILYYKDENGEFKPTWKA